jgi:predicted transposase YbfD/YdcC
MKEFALNDSVQLVESIIAFFQDVPDPRLDRRKKHPLLSILVCAFCAVIADCNTWIDIELFCRERIEWFEKYIDLPNGVPSHDTFGRVFSILDPLEMEKCLIEWAKAIRFKLEKKSPDGIPPIINLDGKRLKGSADKIHKKNGVHLLNAWLVDSGLCIGQIEAEEKENEITVAPDLIKLLDLKGTIVTGDALLTQKGLAEKIQHCGGDYLFALKANHELALTEVQGFFEQIARQSTDKATNNEAFYKPIKFDYSEIIEKNGGRIETRRYWASSDIAWFQEKSLWKGLTSFVMAECTREIGDQKSIEKRYYLTSLTGDAKTLGIISRKHWSIENSLHYVLDVIFKEDESRVRLKKAARNLSALRKLALNIVSRIEGEKASKRLRRKKACWSTSYLERCLLAVA